jgi:hypothetical protein
MEEQQLPDSAQVASAIRAADTGDSRAAEQLFAALYGELHRMGERQLNRNASARHLALRRFCMRLTSTLRVATPAFQIERVSLPTLRAPCVV